MAELFTTPWTVTLAANYTAGSGTLSVSAAAPAAIQNGKFSVALGNGTGGAQSTVLTVLSGSNTTTWTVAAETNDANASSGATVYGNELSARALTALLGQSSGGGQPIAQAVASGSQATLTLALPSGYTDLMIVVTGRSQTAALTDNVFMQVNGDTGTNYYRLYMGSSLGTTPTAANADATAQALVTTLTGATAPTNVPGNAIIFLPAYSGTSFQKTASVIGGNRSGATNSNSIDDFFWNWTGTAAITTVTFGTSSGANFVAGTVISVYPVGSAGSGSPIAATQGNVTSSRALNTTYQNTTAYPLLVAVTNYASNTGSTQAICDSSSTPTTQVASASGGNGWNRELFFVVPPGYYYKITYDVSTTLSTWFEWTLTGGGGGTSTAITTKSAAYTATASDGTILANAASAAFTVTLPGSPTTGQQLTIKKIDSTSNVVTISGNGKNIDNASSLGLSSQYASYTVQYDGTSAWWVL